MKKLIKIGGQFSGVGAFDYALKRLGIDFVNVYQAEWDKYARKTYLKNHSEPVYYVNDVHNTPTEEITEKYGSLDIAMFSPPCQAFSLAGKRKGEDDNRGVLFYNSHEFIQKNNPRYFIFENVKGLLSDDNGRTFQRWIDYLGGKSVNGTQTMFPEENSVPYHVYYQVLNAKDYGVPQNRERIFIIGIRDDTDNNFNFPKPFELKKRLKDVLEENVDEKYYLSDKMISFFTKHSEKHSEKGNGFKFQPKKDDNISNCITARCSKMGIDDNYLIVNSATPKVKFQLTGGKWDKTHEQSGRVYDENGIAPTIHTMGGGNQEPKVAVSNDLLREPIIQRIGNYSKSNHNASSIVDNRGISPTVM